MKRIITLLFIFLLPIPTMGQDSSRTDVTHEFTRADTSYSFRGHFCINADPECLLRIIYDFNHISKFTGGARSINVIRQGDDWYDVRYVYRRYLVIENTSTWHRTLKQDEMRIEFEMISSDTNLGILPEILSSAGYYQISPHKDDWIIEYYQECSIEDKNLKKTFVNQAEKDAMTFLLVFKDYISKTCGNRVRYD